MPWQDVPWKHTFLSLCCLVAAQPGLPVPTYRAASKTSPVCTGRSQLDWQPVWCQSAQAVETMNLSGTKTVLYISGLKGEALVLL